MKEHEHHDEPSGDDQSVILARLDQRHQDARDRRERERQARSQRTIAKAEEMLRGLNRGEPLELAVASPRLRN